MTMSSPWPALIVSSSMPPNAALWRSPQTGERGVDPVDVGCQRERVALVEDLDDRARGARLADLDAHQRLAEGLRIEDQPERVGRVVDAEAVRGELGAVDEHPDLVGRRAVV